jgi:DNA-directed RNA polymerase subunit RPC12/RpoP
MIANDRVKVTIRCKICGERFVLKGRKEKGKIDTGFKQCVCSNDKDFDIETKDF